MTDTIFAHGNTGDVSAPNKPLCLKLDPYAPTLSPLLTVSAAANARGMDATVIFMRDGKLMPAAKKAFGASELPGHISAPAKGGASTFYTEDAGNVRQWIVINADPRKINRPEKVCDFTHLDVRALGRLITKAVRTKNWCRVFVVPEDFGVKNFDAAHTAYELVLGAQVASYQPGVMKSTAPTGPFELVLKGKADELREIVLAACDMAAGIRFQRILGDARTNVMGTREMVEIARALADFGFEIDVIDGNELERQGFGGVLAVGGGAAKTNPPAVVVIKHIVNPGKPINMFVGKGLVFDDGGRQDKSVAMYGMHLDMYGSATVLGSMFRLGLAKRRGLGKHANVCAIIGLVENNGGSRSYRPGDVLTMRNGKTVDVEHTDAEGRLVLADCLDLACDILAANNSDVKGSRIVEFSTLTGANVVGLGHDHAGLFADADIREELLAAAASSGDWLWPMPFGDEEAALQSSRLNSAIADMISNSGDRFAGGATVAAMFLNRFIKTKNTRFAHVDIANWITGSRDPAGGRAGNNFANGMGVGFIWKLIRKHRKA